MNQPPAFQFYASDYLSSSKVQRMTLEAEGAYIRLLAYNWQDGWIPSDIAKLARLCKTTPRKMQTLWDDFLCECFTSTEQPAGRLVNPRLEQVRSDQVEFRNKKSGAGQLGAAARWKDKQTDGTAIDVPLANGMANDGPSSPSPVFNKTPKSPTGDSAGYSPEFLDFWKQYPRKQAKGAAWKAWRKLHPSAELRVDIAQAIEKQRYSPNWLRDNGAYIPHPSTWLNERRWEDENPANPSDRRMPENPVPIC